jgi:hypothetical protein
MLRVREMGYITCQFYAKVGDEKAEFVLAAVNFSVSEMDAGWTWRCCPRITPATAATTHSASASVCSWLSLFSRVVILSC